MKTWLFLFLVATQLYGLGQQQADSKQENIPTIKTSSHLVVVDVVAQDEHGRPVTDLGREDFVILEDGKPQQVKQFEPHVSASTASAPAAPAPAETKPVANEYKNVPEQVPNAVNVILLDLLGTAMPDQTETRRQLLDLLKKMPKGRQVALYLLDTKLHLLQNFTGNSDTLIAAAEKAAVAPSSLKQAAMDKEEDGQMVLMLRESTPAAAERFKAMTQLGEASKMDYRVDLTLQALQQIARSLAGIPGRKNLIWLSSGFPLKTEGEINPTGPSVTPRDYTQAVRKTTAVLAEAQIAIYPVDVQGLNFGGIGATTDAAGTLEMIRRRDDPVVDPVTSTYATESASSHNSMELVAKDTGGQAFYNGNNLKDAIGRSMDLGSSYYTLAYTPTNNEWNGSLRKIEVKSSGKKLKLFYRRSYYAYPDRDYSVAELEKILVSSMDPEIADSTMLTLDAKVSPGTKGPNSITLECSLDRSQFQFVDAGKDQRAAMIDLAIESWDKHGKLSGKFGQSLKIAAAPSQTRVTFRQQIDLQPNTASLRIGILDRTSGRIGTVQIAPVPISTQAENKTDAKPEARP